MQDHRHFYSNGKRLYRSRDRMLFGVCRGIAEWKDLPVGWVRFFTFLAFTFTGFFPVGLIYFLAAVFLPIEPDEYFDSRGFKSSNYDDGKYRRRYDSEDDWERRYSRKKKGDEHHK